jgi:hypothetical protein
MESIALAECEDALSKEPAQSMIHLGEGIIEMMK